MKLLLLAESLFISITLICDTWVITTVNGEESTTTNADIVLNTQCDISPTALTNAFQSQMVDISSSVSNKEVSFTCLESTGYAGRRCFYTYIPDCATLDSPLVYDIHGMSLCPLWNFQTTGWIQKSIENCFVIVWPMVSEGRSVHV